MSVFKIVIIYNNYYYYATDNKKSAEKNMSLNIQEKIIKKAFLFLTYNNLRYLFPIKMGKNRIKTLFQF